ncbi:MAG: carboxylating nicotinate-nucleotide diphosphorylase [Campylobacterales bacterium]
MELMEFQILEFLKEVLREDIGRGDWSRLIVDRRARGVVIAKSEGVIGGMEYIHLFEKVAEVSITPFKLDGEEYRSGEVILEIEGEGRDLLTIERSLLNILQHGSGIATQTRRFVEATGGRILILDTRKTRPLLRQFEKYAVRCGGGKNHRLGLDECLMLKDTHLALFPTIGEAVRRAREVIPFTMKIEVECETLKMAEEALKAGVEIVMCDNMEEEQIREVVDLRNRLAPQTLVEVSGNITIDRLKGLVELGVDAVSSGSLIHQATFKDFSLKIRY